MSLGRYQDIHRTDPEGRGNPRFWHPLIRFRHFIDGSLALASLNRTCRNHCPDVSAALTTVAFDQNGPRWLGSSAMIAEPKGPTFISYKVARSRLDPRSFVTQDPNRKSTLLTPIWAARSIFCSQRPASSHFIFALGTEFIEALSKTVRAAVNGNVGTLIVLQVG